MKTAISVDGELLAEADRAAGEMGLSRSRLISLALEAYLGHRRQEVCSARGPRAMPQVLTVDKSELAERVGRLPEGAVEAIRCGLQLLFDSSHR